MHGGIRDGRGIGSIGDVGSFSFQQTKTMSSGEGGICITNNSEIADRLFRIKQIGYGQGELPRQLKSAPPSDLMCYNLRATAFHPVILHQQLDSLDQRLDGYTRAVRYLEQRLSHRTRIRFQTPGKKADRQGRYGWVMIFDDPVYANVSIDFLQRALVAEGVPVFRAEGPIYHFVLFNVDPKHYRIDQPCLVTEAACARILWLLHPYLGLPESQLDKIAAAIEKVACNIKALKGSK